ETLVRGRRECLPVGRWDALVPLPGHLDRTLPPAVGSDGARKVLAAACHRSAGRNRRAIALHSAPLSFCSPLGCRGERCYRAPEPLRGGATCSPRVSRVRTPRPSPSCYGSWQPERIARCNAW